jgi:hypothetical protein
MSCAGVDARPDINGDEQKIAVAVFTDFRVQGCAP